MRKIALLWLVLILCSCNENPSKIRIAQQYGLAYAPLQILLQQETLEKLLPETTVEWVQLGNTAAIREAILSGQLDIGFMGLPPFLIGLDKGMPWRLFTGLSAAPLGLISGNSSVSRLEDFSPEHRIALPQPGSIQHILLAMAAENSFGSAEYFDNQLVSMNHPDALAALESGSITAHFTSPPYIWMELENPSNRLLLSGEEAMGAPFTFIAGAVTEEFATDQPETLKILITALEEASALIDQNPEEAARLLSPLYPLPEETLLMYLEQENLIFSSELRGLDAFIDFMTRQGYLTHAELNRDQVILEIQ